MNNTNNKMNNYYQLPSNHYYLVNNKIDQIQIKNALLSLFNVKLNKINENQVILIFFKVKQNPNKFRTISLLQKVKVKDFELLTEFFNECWINKSKEDYQNQKWDYIVFSYKILELNSHITETKLNKNFDTENDKENSYSFGYHKLPNTMDYTKWGEVIFKTNTTAIVTKLNSNLIYFIKLNFNELEVEVRTKNYSMKNICTFVDTLDDENNLSSFTRSIGNKNYVFEDGNFKQLIDNDEKLNNLFEKKFISYLENPDN